MVIYSNLLEAGPFGQPTMSSKDELAGTIEWRGLVLIVEGIVTLKKQVSDKDDVIAKLNDELTRLRNKVFGHTSGKYLPIDTAQLLPVLS